ncbi:imidazole glycerol phosphate synthase subunit HisH [Streptomyces sp. SM12]|uniref:imidazole glycerol phosphate synthase subunit HisH n=1 Tax=Streptomyces sp. SM12 TaxID=1071602 RepID=UPI000CD4ED22|nr:imidazole glycerol phosphate synthase subunit HisH [Streptomyces sp. SM12]
MQDDRPVVGVIDYRTGNSQSVVHALNFLGVPNRLLTSPNELIGADRIILPGVGSAGTAMAYLSAAGWPEELRGRVVDGDTPFLGICVGLQILFESSEEQDAECLGWLPGSVQAFDGLEVRVPQMGWNQVHRTSGHPFLAGLPEAGHFYFVNSFYAVPADAGDTAATTEYGVPFTSAVARGNIMATQFHAEKSGPLGLDLLSRFATTPQEELCLP